MLLRLKLFFFKSSVDIINISHFDFFKSTVKRNWLICILIDGLQNNVTLV